jgi:hypothetical protein
MSQDWVQHCLARPDAARDVRPSPGRRARVSKSPLARRSGRCAARALRPSGDERRSARELRAPDGGQKNPRGGAVIRRRQCGSGERRYGQRSGKRGRRPGGEEAGRVMQRAASAGPAARVRRVSMAEVLRVHGISRQAGQHARPRAEPDGHPAFPPSSPHSLPEPMRQASGTASRRAR